MALSSDSPHDHDAQWAVGLGTTILQLKTSSSSETDRFRSALFAASPVVVDEPQTTEPLSLAFHDSDHDQKLPPADQLTISSHVAEPVLEMPAQTVVSKAAVVAFAPAPSPAVAPPLMLLLIPSATPTVAFQLQQATAHAAVPAATPAFPPPSFFVATDPMSPLSAAAPVSVPPLHMPDSSASCIGARISSQLRHVPAVGRSVVAFTCSRDQWCCCSVCDSCAASEIVCDGPRCLTLSGASCVVSCVLRSVRSTVVGRAPFREVWRFLFCCYLRIGQDER